MKTLPSLATSDDNITSDRLTIANTLNSYFKDVGKDLYHKLPSIATTPIVNDYTCPSTLWLFHATTDEVLNKI